MKDRLNFRIPMFTDKGSFLEFQYIHLGDVIECTLCGYNGEAEQCTGLKDKNGKLIYEGDIVRLVNSKDNTEEIRLVTFKDCAFQFNLPNSMQIDRPLYCWAINYHNRYKHIEIEVIGNIYQHPERLEFNTHSKVGEVK